MRHLLILSCCCIEYTKILGRWDKYGHEVYKCCCRAALHSFFLCLASFLLVTNLSPHKVQGYLATLARWLTSMCCIRLPLFLTTFWHKQHSHSPVSRRLLEDWMKLSTSSTSEMTGTKQSNKSVVWQEIHNLSKTYAVDIQNNYTETDPLTEYH